MIHNILVIGGDCMYRLKQLREDRNLTQENLAKLLKVGRTTVTLWESGVNKPRADMLVKISEILECSIDDLLCTDRKEFRHKRKSANLSVEDISNILGISQEEYLDIEEGRKQASTKIRKLIEQIF